MSPHEPHRPQEQERQDDMLLGNTTRADGQHPPSTSKDDRYANWPPVQHPRVRGRCPACGSESLFLGSDGYVTCAVIGCKDPCAPHDLLGMPQDSVIRHRLREFVKGCHLAASRLAQSTGSESLDRERAGERVTYATVASRIEEIIRSGVECVSKGDTHD